MASMNTVWCKEEAKTTCSIPVCGSVFGCHCENSFPDTHNNIQCSRNSTKHNKTKYINVFRFKKIFFYSVIE